MQCLDVISNGGITSVATNAEIVVATLAPAAGGGFTLDGEPFAGGTVTLEGGFEYVVSQAADGTWMAVYCRVEERRACRVLYAALIR